MLENIPCQQETANIRNRYNRYNSKEGKESYQSQSISDSAVPTTPFNIISNQTFFEGKVKVSQEVKWSKNIPGQRINRLNKPTNPEANSNCITHISYILNIHTYIHTYRGVSGGSYMYYRAVCLRCGVCISMSAVCMCT